MAATLDPADAGSWTNWVTNFDQTYQQFQDNFNGLVAQQDYVTTVHPELLPTFNDLVARGQQNAATLTQLKATRDYVASWLQTVNSGLQTASDFVTGQAQAIYDAAKAALGLGAMPRVVLRKGLHGLGIAPLVVIGVAAAAAALVVIAYWIKDAYNFAQRLNALQAQEAALAGPGGTITPTIASQAQAIVDGTLGPAPGSAASINDNLLGIPWTWLITGAVLVFLGPPLVEALNKKAPARG